MNETMTKTEVMLIDDVMMELETDSRTEDDKNPNLPSIFSLGYQWCRPSQFICLTFAPTFKILT